MMTTTAKQRAAARRNLVKARTARKPHYKGNALAFTGRLAKRGNPVRTNLQRSTGVRRGAGDPNAMKNALDARLKVRYARIRAATAR